MTDLSAARPGDYIAIATNGWQAKVIRFAERHNVNPEDREGAWANHVAIVGEGGTIYEADPHVGFRASRISEYADCHVALSSRPLTDSQREIGMGVATALLGIPYNMLDILALGVSSREAPTGRPHRTGRGRRPARRRLHVRRRHRTVPSAH